VLDVETITYSDMRGIRRSVDVEAESLYEAVVFAVRRFAKIPGPKRLVQRRSSISTCASPPRSTPSPCSRSERWLDGATSSA
jgi:hypothetical protein